MVVCAGVATVTIALGVVGWLPAAARRLGAVEIPIPVRPIAAVLVMASIIAAPVRPRPASATIAPPIVRLTDAAQSAGATPATSTPAAEPHATVRLDRSASRHVVQPGECLWKIARDTLADRGGADPSNTEIARFWPAIYEMNRALIGEDPNLIHPGQSLQIPEA